MINEINGQITQKLKKQEFSFLPMTHILITWAHLWSFIKLSCTVQELWQFLLIDFTFFTNLGSKAHSERRSRFTPGRAIAHKLAHQCLGFCLCQPPLTTPGKSSNRSSRHFNNLAKLSTIQIIPIFQTNVYYIRWFIKFHLDRSIYSVSITIKRWVP